MLFYFFQIIVIIIIIAVFISELNVIVYLFLVCCTVMFLRVYLSTVHHGRFSIPSTQSSDLRPR